MSEQLVLVPDAPKSPVTADDVMRALLKKYGGFGYNTAAFEELRIGTGYGKDVEQRIDLWVMRLWPSDGLARLAFEVKVSRQDFRNEMKKPLKRRAALLYSNLFYFAAPKGLIKPEELPVEAGLVEVDGNRCVTAVPAPWRDISPPSWRFMASIARRAVEAEHRLAKAEQR